MRPPSRNCSIAARMRIQQVIACSAAEPPQRPQRRRRSGDGDDQLSMW